MRFKKLLFIVPVVFMLAISACAPQQASTPTPRMLSVNGNARVTAAPDIAYISVGVHTESDKASKAVEGNNFQAVAIAEAIKNMGVEEKDIQTMGFNIYPQDEWGPEGERIGTRYIVDNTVQITVRDISRIGELLGAAVDAGANSVYGIQFDIEDKTELIAQARKLAVENAQVQAQELAAAAGVTLGEVQSLSYYNSTPPPVYDNKMVAGVGGGAGGVPISPGQLTITADVSVTYEIR